MELGGNREEYKEGKRDGEESPGEESYPAR